MNRADYYPPDYYPKFEEVKKAFEDAGFEMLDYRKKNWDCICSSTRGNDELGFTIAFRQRQDAKDGDRIWQVHWVGFDQGRTRDPQWFNDRVNDIRRLGYNDCCVTDTGRVHNRFKLWIPADQGNHVKSMLEIVRKTKGAMGYQEAQR